jgi:hypothetical protein
MSDKWTVHDFDQAPERPPRPRGRRPVSLQRTLPERRSFNGALVTSVLLHVLLLSQLVGEGQGVPGLVLPWQERRAVVPDIQTVLVPPPPAPAASAPPVAAVEVQRASIRSAPVEAPTPKPLAPPALRRPEPAVAEAPAPRPAPPAEAPRNTVAEAVPLNLPPPVLTAEPTDVPTPVVPVAPEPVLAASAVEPSASSPDPVALAKREAALEAQRLETERQETARQQAAAQLEAQRQEVARQAAVRAEAARLEAARLETERQEAARQAAAKLEAQRQEAARQATVRAEATRLEAERQEAARQEAARAQAAQQEAAAKREAVLRAIGRQLDEERARRDAAANATPSPSGTLPLSLGTARRARLFGHTDPNADLVAYAQAWALKLQLNTLPDTVREVTRRPHTPPTVTVALRSDGSVESVAFVVSSGVPEVDDAIRRMVEAQRPYAAFPPALARLFDVVEIRRTWYFDAAVRLH